MRAHRKVLLVGWDSADWKIISPLMDRGEMPLMNKLVSGGVMGNLRTLEPILSPLLWTSIATGKRAYDHGILGFTDVDPITGNVRPVTSASRQCKAVWNILAQHGLISHIVGWLASHGERIPGGSVVSNLFPVPTALPGAQWPPAPRGTIWPEEDAAALNPLRVNPLELDGDVLSMFVPRWCEVDQLADQRLAQLRIHLAECFSIQAAATSILENKEWDFLAVYFRALDEISHHFMPFHPPKMDGIIRREFDVYRDVVNSAYRLHDLMLARLVALAGPDATVIVVSDHGFHSDHLRPKFVPRVPAGITVWHRPQGIFAANGPGLLQDELIHGASLIDITPTILTLFDLPVGTDMEGKVLLQAFREPPVVNTVPTWETEPGSSDESSYSIMLSREESRVLLDQFAALGYIDDQGIRDDQRVVATERENSWSLSRALIDGGRYADALPLLEQLHEELPDRVDIGQVLARCQLYLGLHEEARASIDATLEKFGRKAVANLLRAEIAYGCGEYDASLECLEAARAESPRSVAFWRQLALTYLKLHRWSDAESTCRTALDIDSDDPMVWLGLAHSQMRTERFQEAADSALAAISLKFDMPRAHLNLGWALMELGDYDRAKQALGIALRLSPDLARAHLLLSSLHSNLGDEAGAEHHRERWYEQLETWKDKSRQVDMLRQEAAERARYRKTERASAREDPTRHVSSHEAQVVLDASLPDFVIVSGLPRSGTSLMMQLLQAGGMELMTDSVREADEHNELGYFEWDEICRLRRNPRSIEKAAGMAVKVISSLVSALPPQYRYKVVFMRRPLADIAASQHRMRYGRHAKLLNRVADMIPILQKHEEETLSVLRNAPQIELLEIDYPELVRTPSALIKSVVNFVGPDRLPNSEEMASAVRPELQHEVTHHCALPTGRRVVD